MRQRVKSALIGAGGVEACMHVLHKRCSDLSQGVVKHGHRALQATASLLQELVTEQPAKQLAFKYGALCVCVSSVCLSCAACVPWCRARVVEGRAAAAPDPHLRAYPPTAYKRRQAGNSRNGRES